MEIHHFLDKRYYRYDDLVQSYPALAKGCRTKAVFIKRHGLTSKHYLYARFNKEVDAWQVSAGNSCRVDKFFIRKRYVDAHMIPDGEEEDAIEDLPPRITSTEVFRDGRGRRLEIEVVGERGPAGKCYLRLKDIANTFGLYNLKKAVTHTQHGGYQRGKDYQVFRRPDGRPEPYLTPRGFVRMVFVTRSETTHAMENVVANTLFYKRFGTPEQKENAPDLLGMLSVLTARFAVPNAVPISCIYLFVIGTVADLRESMEIDRCHRGSSLVCKWGRTSDLRRRTEEHLPVYGAIPGSSFRLEHHAPVDNEHTKSAEWMVRQMMTHEGVLFKYGSYSELAIIPQRLMWEVVSGYDAIAQSYLPISTPSPTLEEEEEEMADPPCPDVSCDDDCRALVSCIYLFEIGTVADLRQSMSIPDDHPDTSSVYKFGRTCDLDKRARNHAKTYGKLRGANLQLAYHGYVDPQQAAKAETRIAHSMDGMKLLFEYSNHRELIIASKKELKHVREQYDIVTENCRGGLKDIARELETLKQEKESLLISTRHEVLIAQQETALAKKDNEILQLKLQLAERSQT